VIDTELDDGREGEREILGFVAHWD
jgi:hypothetical protein